MLRLVLAELRHNLRLWVGAFIVIAAAATILAISAGLFSTAFDLWTTDLIGDQDIEGIIGFAAMPAFLVAITTVVVITSVAQLTVSEQRHSYALWQLVGVSPRKVTGVVMRQLAILSLLAAATGVLVGWPFIQPLFDWLGTRVPSLAGLTASLSPVAVALVVLASVLLTLVGGIRPARAAGATPPIMALRSSATPHGGMSIARWIWCALLLLAGVGMGAGIQSIPLSGIGSTGVFIPFVFGCAVACMGPILVPLLLRAWTALIPLTLSPSWFLARNASRYRVTQSASAIVPLSLGLILVGSFTSVLAMFDQALTLESGRGGPPADTTANLVVYGAPLILATLAAAVTVFMSGRARERENALILAAGTTRATIIATAVLEAVIYTATATILALIVLIPSLGIVWAGMDKVVPRTEFIFDWIPFAGLAVLGLAALIISTVAPTIYANRISIRAALAA
ncbi:FtsX-like permease family protein [Paeniglutamicibacter antarcticus]|uniref:FtsX-like permease family protein n=1 Tax=Arthrobacter terrae TaxID=2935737 RepID=A0A931CTK3_9MICC|nr:FtsX-like permease family protein [Arthrobacter terrae]MBG0741169.1 FtsX-like permease family protein [Arthrobacter terrae]